MLWGIWTFIAIGGTVAALALDHYYSKRPITDEMRQNSIDRRARQDAAWEKAKNDYKKSRWP